MLQNEVGAGLHRTRANPRVRKPCKIHSFLNIDRNRVSIFPAPSVENGGYADLVDERGNHADILKFASKADIVVCCLAMNNETIGIVNNDFISVMRKGVVLINIAQREEDCPSLIKIPPICHSFNTPPHAQCLASSAWAIFNFGDPNIG